MALARALVIRPAMLLLDEPLSNLDLKLREEMRFEISGLQRRLGIATVFVTHDQAEALTMSDRIAVMRAGRIEQLGTPSDIYERPVTQFVAGFIGNANLVPDGGRLLVIRPERLKLCDAGAVPDSMRSWPAVVERVMYLGARLELRLRLGDGTVLLVDAVNDGSLCVAEGGPVTAWSRPEDAWPVPAG